MIALLKLLIILITTVLSILAVTSDFKDEKSKKLKKTGYVYIVIFLFLTGLNFIFEKLQDEESEKSDKKNFLSVMEHTDDVLTQTEQNLHKQFDRISLLNNQIDSHLTNTTKYIQNQLDQSLIDQKKIKNLSVKTVSDIGKTFSSLSKIDSSQKGSLKKLEGISNQSETNLESLNNLFNQLNSITSPLIPVQFVFKIKYNLKNALYRTNALKNFKEKGHRFNSVTGKAGENDYLIWLYEYEDDKIRDTYMSPIGYDANDEIINEKIIRKDFFKNYELNFSFYSNSISKKIMVNYCIDDICGKNNDIIYYEISDSSLIREIAITCNVLTANPNQITNLQDLVKNCNLYARFSQFGKREYSLAFIYSDRNLKYHKYNKNISITNMSFEPYLEILYGQNFTMSIKIPMENVIEITQNKREKYWKALESTLNMSLNKPIVQK